MKDIKEITKALLELDVSEYTKEKNGLTYLSWANAYREILKIDSSVTYEIIKNEDGLPIFGNEKIGYIVYTTVTVNGITREMWLPVLDYRNKAIKTPDSFNINTAVMRCLTKNLAMFGLGTYIYAGEDLPEQEFDKDFIIKKIEELKEENRNSILKTFGVEKAIDLTEKQLKEVKTRLKW